ncbi:MAG: CvpA family protein [Candidatus Aminicenantes bacterium]|nr:CvpA family protein [Candidatus Aminicenantes bacterium]
MGLVWIDWVILIILVGAIISGLIKGLVRQLIFIAFILIGFIIAGNHFTQLALSIRPAMASDSWAKLIAFLLIFLGFLLAGWLIGFIFSKLMKGPLKALDVILGGLFGFLKGVLIAAVFVLALLLFPIKEKELAQSELAFPCLRVGQFLIQLVPQGLKKEFYEAYQKLKGERAIRKV